MTVILRYLALVSSKLYFSGLSVEPLLLLLDILENFTPSFDADITKLFCLSFPLYHAILTLQIFLLVPKSSCIHEPTPLLDHLVLRLLSRTFEPGNPA